MRKQVEKFPGQIIATRKVGVMLFQMEDPVSDLSQHSASESRSLKYFVSELIIIIIGILDTSNIQGLPFEKA